MSEPSPRCVLVLRFSAVGDIVLTAPALQSLRAAWPDTRVVFVTKASFTPLVAHNPNVHAVVGLAENESLWSLRGRALNHEPDAVLDLHDKLRSLGLRWSVGARRTVVWAKRPWYVGAGVRLGLMRHRSTTRLASRYHQAVETMVGHSLPPGQLRFFVPDEAKARVRVCLAQAGIQPGQTLVGMAPGAMWPTKCWPRERFAALARRCLRAGLAVVVTGSAAEAPLTAAVALQAPGVVDLGTTINLADLGALVDACQVFVANDSGPMHIARALGVPTLAFFGTTDPGQFDFDGHGLMYADLPCSPCSLYGLRRCPQRHFECMGRLEVDTAWRVLEGLVSAGRRPFLTG